MPRLAGKLRTSSLAWYLVLSACALMSAYQIVQLAKDWSDRPVETIEDMLSKQQIPFPSITICPEGTTLYPALEMYLKKKNLKVEDFQVSVKSYLRTQLEDMRHHLTSNSFLTNGLLGQICENGAADYPSFTLFCRFSSKVMRIMGQRLLETNFYTKVSELYFSLENRSFGFFHHIGYLQYSSPLRKLLSDMNMLRFNPKDLVDDKLVFLYTYLGVLQVVEEKVKDNTINVLDLYFKVINKSQGRNCDQKSCVVSSFPTNALMGYEQTPVLPPLLLRNSLIHTEKQWEEGLKEFKEQSNSTCCTGESSTFYKDMYIIYMQLVYLQSTDLSKNLESKIVQLMMHETYQELPGSLVSDYKEEIQQELIKLTRNETSLNNVYWNVKEAVDFLSTFGKTTLDEKLRKAFITNHQDENLIKEATLTNNPLTKCKENKYKNLCQRLKQLPQMAKNQDLLELLHNTAHPLMYSTHKSTSSQPTSVLPFCFIGKQIANFSDSLNELKNFKDASFEYEFCTKAQHVYTDAGLCTTLNFPDLSDLLNENFQPLKKNKNKLPLLYPQKVIKDKFEDGFLLVLDSCAFDTIVSKNRDSEGTLHWKTSKESIKMNNFKIILHEKNELPMHLLPQSSIIRLHKDNDISSLQSFFTEIKVEVEEADDSIRSISIEKRKCRFEDETFGLKMFSLYSESNCMYECQTKLAKQKCGCIPWNFPHTKSDNVCDLFGNFCFNNNLLWLVENIYTIKNIGEPPCGCYPNCRSYKYKPMNTKVEKKSPQWFNSEKLLSTYEQLKVYDGVFDFDKVRYMRMFYYNLAQFLAPFVFDTISPKWSPMFDHRETYGQLQFLFSNNTAKDFSAKNTDLSTRIKNLAIYRLDFDGTHYRVRKKIRRMTFANMLSAFGGILGLFTGFNMLVLFEVCFWLKQFMNKLVWKN